MANQSPEERIVKWVVRNSHNDATPLLSRPEYTVNAHELLDEIANIVGLSKEQINRWVEEETGHGN